MNSCCLSVFLILQRSNLEQKSSLFVFLHSLFLSFTRLPPGCKITAIDDHLRHISSKFYYIVVITILARNTVANVDFSQIE